MKAHVSKKRWRWSSDDWKNLIVLALGIAATVLILIFFDLPSLQPMRDSLVSTILIKTLISGPVLYFAWIWRNRPPMFERIAVSIFAAVPWLAMFIESDRIILAIEMILFYTLLTAFIKHFVTDKKYYYVTGAAIVFPTLDIVLAEGERYVYKNNNGDIHFWQIGLIAAIIVTAVFTFLMAKGIIHFKENTLSLKILVPLMVFAATFIFAAFTVGNLNYALDFSKPIEYHTSIREKRISTGKITEYTFILNADGEEREFNVSQSEYYRKDAGDYVTVQLYQGAFGHEYYTYKE